MKRTFISLFVFISLLASFTTRAQDSSIIHRAMKDELSRSMAELKLDSLEKPFYISYLVNDIENTTMIASLGGLINTMSIPGRSKGVRILVGNYELNDESIDNNLFSRPEVNEIALPLDDDYLGIRRAFWSTTDNVYKNAARQFAKNKADLAEQKKQLTEIPHRTFAKAPVVQLSIDPVSSAFDKEKWENQLRQLSALFLSHEIETSRIILSFNRGIYYFVNSEGTSIKVPIQLASLMIVGQSITTEGEMVFDQLQFHHRSPDLLPEMATLVKEVNAFIERLEKAKKSRPFEDEYTGPVLFMGPAVADAFSRALFQGRDRLTADNSLPNSSGIRERSANSEMKVGKSIASANLTVKAVGKLESYNGIPLMGAFQADQEGVVPPDELTLIDKGIFQNQLNDRTLTQMGQTPNGHNDGPGVISVSIMGAVSEADLKKKLIEQAKAEGLEYGVIVRDAAFGPTGIANIYKVSLETGDEELVRSAMFRSLSMKSLKKISGCSKETTAYNLSLLGNNGITSYITPRAVLLEGIELQQAQLPVIKEEEYVKSPIKK